MQIQENSIRKGFPRNSLEFGALECFTDTHLLFHLANIQLLIFQWFTKNGIGIADNFLFRQN